MKRRAITIAICSCLVTLFATGSAYAQLFDISSGGAPTITGSSGGSVTGSANVTQNLAVTINFGELSPMNANNIVTVRVPIAVRSRLPYQVTAQVMGAISPDPQAIQRTDIGFGVINVNRMGGQAFNCSNHVVPAPFANDPAVTVFTAANGRAAYPSSNGNLAAPTVILSGPIISRGLGLLNRANNNGYSFDAIFAIRPQFYSSGVYGATIIFTISAGPIVLCL